MIPSLRDLRLHRHRKTGQYYLRLLGAGFGKYGDMTIEPSFYAVRQMCIVSIFYPRVYFDSAKYGQKPNLRTSASVQSHSFFPRATSTTYWLFRRMTPMGV